MGTKYKHPKLLHRLQHQLPNQKQEHQQRKNIIRNKVPSP